MEKTLARLCPNATPAINAAEVALVEDIFSIGKSMGLKGGIKEERVEDSY